MTSSENDLEPDAPVAAFCDPENLVVRLQDGRVIVTPLWWYPRLLAATPAQCNALTLSRSGVHWDEIDEDLSVAGMLGGSKAPGAVPPKVAAE
mgnify:CR=1 FL=1